MMALKPLPLSWQLLPLLISRLSALPNLEPLLLSPLLILNLYSYHSMMSLTPLPLPLCFPLLLLFPSSHSLPPLNPQSRGPPLPSLNPQPRGPPLLTPAQLADTYAALPPLHPQFRFIEHAVSA